MSPVVIQKLVDSKVELKQKKKTQTKNLIILEKQEDIGILVMTDSKDTLIEKEMIEKGIET